LKKFVLTVVAAAVLAVTFSACEILDPEEHGRLVPLTVDEDPSLPYIAVNGTLLHSESFGDPNDPMIVVLHGGPGGDYQGMLKCTAFAADGFFVVFYDQRGCGLSKRHDKEMFTSQGPALFIDDLAGVIRHYRTPGQKVILMGLSWGAMLATAYVNEHPDDISGVVLMEPGGFTWPDTEAYLKRWQTLDLFAETINDRVFVDQLITGSDHEKLDYKAAIQGAAEYAKGNKLGIAGPSPCLRMGAVCAAGAIEYANSHSFDFTTHLQQYDRPVLFAYSELNQAYGKSHAEHVSSAYPRVQLAEIRGTGHNITHFGWENFYPVALAYLNTVR
jgi:proline iminopeptidase